MAELSYTNEDGDSVKTSQFLTNRGSCCKTSCLHCPYNFTITKHGLEFKKVDLTSITKGQAIIDSNSPKEEDSISAALLSSAFGGVKKKEVISKYQLDNYRFIYLNGHECGIVKVGTVGVSALYLKEHFKEQGLDIDLVSSYYQA